MKIELRPRSVALSGHRCGFDENPRIPSLQLELWLNSGAAMTDFNVDAAALLGDGCAFGSAGKRSSASTTLTNGPA